jgi:hypothetical protein
MHIGDVTQATEKIRTSWSVAVKQMSDFDVWIIYFVGGSSFQRTDRWKGSLKSSWKMKEKVWTWNKRIVAEQSSVFWWRANFMNTLSAPLKRRIIDSEAGFFCCDDELPNSESIRMGLNNWWGPCYRPKLILSELIIEKVALSRAETTNDAKISASSLQQARSEQAGNIKYSSKILLKQTVKIGRQFRRIGSWFT